MKKLVFIVLATALATTAHAGWWRTYGGEGEDDGHCIQLTSDGNYIIAGVKGDSLCLIKTDTSGEIIWAHTYGNNTGIWVEQTSDGEFVIAGTHETDLLKVNSVGDSIWSQDYGIASKCVQETSDSGYIVTGSSNDRLALVRTNSQGDTLWTRFYTEPGNNLNRGYFIQITNDGGYIITGMTGYSNEEGYGWSLLWLIRTDSEGNLLWTRKYGLEEYEHASEGNCVLQTSNGGFVVVGGTDNGLWFLLTDSTGDTLQTHIYKSGEGGEGYNIQPTIDSGYIITGSTAYMVAMNTLSLASGDLWLLKTNNEGDTLWTRTYGGDNSDAGRCVQPTQDSGFVVTGYTSSFGPEGLYLLKTDSLGLLGIVEQPITNPHLHWKVLSSVGDKIVFCYSDMPQGFHASIFDVTGCKVDELHSLNPNGTLTWGETHFPGVYFIKINDKNSTVKLVLVR